ncbi:MAG: hypothetical protein Kow0031_27770 [Anaerolineae bacterium]
MTGSKSRILMADPDPDVSRAVQVYLENSGHTVELLDTAAEVIPRARQWQPNAILISTELSDQNPYQVCRGLLADTLTGHIPIIMLLHLDNRRAKLEALEVGADDTVTKPIDLEELKLRIEAAIRLSTLRVNV